MFQTSPIGQRCALLSILSPWNIYILSVLQLCSEVLGGYGGGCGGGRGGDSGSDGRSSDLTFIEEDMNTTGESFPVNLGRFRRVFFQNANGHTDGRTDGRILL